jgi:hypothetical protein
MVSLHTLIFTTECLFPTSFKVRFQLPFVGFRTGTVRVGPSDTVPIPADTVLVQVLHSHRTRIARVMGYTRGSR